MIESNLLSSVIAILAPVCIRLIRINGGIFKGAAGKPVATYSIKGNAAKKERLPDLIGLLPDGKWLAVEIETDRESQRNETRRKSKEMQQSFICTVLETGGVAAFVRNIKEAETVRYEIEQFHSAGGDQ